MPAKHFTNRITGYTWQGPRRLDRLRDILAFSTAIIRIHEEAGDYDGSAVWLMKLTRQAASDLLQDEGLLKNPVIFDGQRIDV